MKEHPNAKWEDVYDLLTYFDIKNFAPWIQSPVLMGVGVQDETCPDRTNFAAYNDVTSPKKWVAYPTYGHDVNPEFYQERFKFFKETLKLK